MATKITKKLRILSFHLSFFRVRLPNLNHPLIKFINAGMDFFLILAKNRQR